MWLYLPLIFALFGLHVYLVKIEKVFPMMMVNGTVWWYVLINGVGFYNLRGWFNRRVHGSGLTWVDLGFSYRADRFAPDWGQIDRAVLLDAVLFIYAYLTVHLL